LGLRVVLAVVDHRATSPWTSGQAAGAGDTSETRLRWPSAIVGELSSHLAGTSFPAGIGPGNSRAPLAAGKARRSVWLQALWLGIRPEVATRGNWHGPCCLFLVLDAVNRLLNESFVAGGTTANLGGDMGSSGGLPLGAGAAPEVGFRRTEARPVGGSAGRSGLGATIPRRCLMSAASPLSTHRIAGRSPKATHPTGSPSALRTCTSWWWSGVARPA
jgi:hypothetical protein